MNTQQIQNYRDAVLASKTQFLKMQEGLTDPQMRLDFEKESVLAIQIIQKNDSLMDVAKTPEGRASISKAICNLAIVGLSLNSATAHAYLVPRKGECCLDISYKGLKHLAEKSGGIQYAQADVVYENDSFTYNGPTEKPSHSSNPFSGDRGQMVGCYCVAKVKGGDFLCEVMDMAEVNKIMQASPGSTASSSPWQKWKSEMMKKAVMKRAFKMWPGGTGGRPLAEAVAIMHANDEKEGVPIHTEEQYSYFLSCLGERTINEDREVNFSGSKPEELFVFCKSLDHEEYGSITMKYKGTIPKGFIGKTDNSIADILAEGQAYVTALVDTMNGTDDESEFLEAWEETSEEIQNYIRDMLRDDLEALVNQL
jgi:recombination protein RecT